MIKKKSIFLCATPNTLTKLIFFNAYKVKFGNVVLNFQKYFFFNNLILTVSKDIPDKCL